MDTSTPKPGGNTAAADPAATVAIVRVGGAEYALPASSVLEVLRMVAITPLAGAPQHVAGVVNLRGRVVPVIDLRRRDGVPAEISLTTPLVVVAGDDTVGMLIVDEVKGLGTAHGADHGEVIHVDGQLRQLLDVASVLSAADPFPG